MNATSEAVIGRAIAAFRIAGMLIIFRFHPSSGKNADRGSIRRHIEQACAAAGVAGRGPSPDRSARL
jgi:hypothetical protein